MHVLFTTPPAAGHVYPTLPVVEELVDRGHRVTYVSGRPLAAEIRHAGAAVVDLGWVPDTRTLAATGLTAETLSADLRAFAAAARALTPRLLDELEADRPDVICADSVPLGDLLAGLLHVPMVSLVPTLATNEHFGPDELIDGFDAGHPGMTAYFAELADWFGSCGLAMPGAMGAVAPAQRPVLVFTTRKFQIAGDTFAANHRFIGTSIPHRARRTPPWSPPQDGAPILLVSLGTAFNNQPDFFTTCLETFADSGFHVVMALGSHIDPAHLPSLPANVETHTHVAQLSVLPHAAAFITHAGMGSVMEALYHQVPVIGVPQAREQAVNANRIQDLGLGYRIDSPTTDNLRHATENAVRDNRIHANLAAMKDAIDDAGGATAAADLIETTADRS